MHNIDTNIFTKTNSMLKKIRFQFFLITASVLLGLVCELIYGQFQHYRYWNVTIYRVQVRQVNTLESMIELLNSKVMNNQEINIDELKKAFQPISDKTPISIYKNNKLLYSSMNPEFGIKEGSRKELTLQSLKITLGIYNPPEWIAFPKGYFFKWITTNPLKWFQDQYIHITVPLMGFTTIIYLFLLVMAFRSRAKFLSNEVLSSLDFIKQQRLKKSNEE